MFKSWKNYLKLKFQQLQKPLQKGTNVTYTSATKECTTSNLQTTKEKKASTIYVDLESLPIKLFYKILETKELSLLGKGNQQSNWDKLIEEYWLYNNKSQYLRGIRRTSKLLAMENKITSLTAILLKSDFKNCEDDLKYWGLSSKEDCKITLNILKTNYEIESFEYERDNKQHGETSNIYKDVVILEQILSRNIDLDKCNVMMWIELNKLAKKISDERNKKK